jgi:hypothetical protein
MGNVGDDLLVVFVTSLVKSVENYEKGNFGSDDVDEWLYDAETTPNSLMSAPVKITDSKSSSTVYVVAFYIGEGDALWYLDVKTSVYEERSTAEDNALKAKYEVKVNAGMLDDLWYSPVRVKVTGD